MFSCVKAYYSWGAMVNNQTHRVGSIIPIETKTLTKPITTHINKARIMVYELITLALYVGSMDIILITTLRLVSLNK